MRKANFLKVFGIFWMIFTFFMFISLANPAEKGFPNRAIEIVVPYAPGGLVDLATRIVSEEFSKNLGVPVVIENKLGGSGVLGFQEVVQAKPDGHTLLSAPNSLILIGSVTQPDTIKVADVIPIARFASAPNVVVVRKDSPFKTLEDVIAFARKNPGKLIASAGLSTGADYFTLELLKMEAGVDISRSSTEGGSESLAGVMKGQIDVGILAANTAYRLLRSGDVRCLASSGGRVPGFSGIPTLTEKGYARAEFGLWVGLLAPKRVDKSVLEKISKTFEETMKTPTVIKRLEESGTVFDYLAGEEFAKEIEKDCKKVAEVIKRTKMISK